MLKIPPTLKLTWFLPIFVLTAACSGNSMQSAYVNDYQKALESKGSQPVENNEAVNGFIEVFNQAQHGEVADIIRQTYAEQLYFNDTFRTITDRNELIEYMEQTGQQVDRLDVRVQDVARSGNDIYVRWIMQMQFKVMGKQVDSKSIGISQLRFNEQGKIILHQDFWDGVDGFYQYLPIIGYSLKKIREKL